MPWNALLPWVLAAATAASAPDTAVVPLGGITVTASRIPERVLRTPSALSVVPHAEFGASREIALTDGLAGIPGVFGQSRAGAQDVRITIRGYGARGNGERSNSGNLRGIRVLTDGIPLTEPDGRTSLDLVDLGSADQIEVSRSNGSAVYGNASGGVVQLRTSLDFARPWLEYQQRLGAYGYHREQGNAGLTMGRGRGMVSLYNSNFDGWREHSRSTTTSVQSRFGTPLDDQTRLGVLADFVSNLNLYPGALTQAQMDADPSQANPKFVTRDERRYNRIGRLGVSLDRGLQGNTSLAAAAFVEPKVLQRSERNRFRDFNRYHVGGNVTLQYRDELSPGLRGTWTAGADDQYQDGAIQFYDLTASGGRGTTLVANKREGANAAGGFVQGELTWNEVWALRAALRFDDLWYLSEDRIDPSLNATHRFTHWTPKGSLARYFERHTIYASVGGGVEAPAFNEIDPPPPYDTLTSFNPFLEPMVSTSVELGAKGEFARTGSPFGRLTYDAALYWIDARNELVPYDGGAYFYTAGRSRRQGIELGLDWSPLEPLILRADATLSRNEYREYRNDVGDFSGNDIAGLPATQLGARARWRLPRGLGVEAGLRQVGHYYADDANTAYVPAYVLLDARADLVRVGAGGGTLRIYVAGENLTDERYVSSVFINGVNGEYYEPGLPRTWSVGIRLGTR